jgi:DHA3 family macrolide efflux protein-like MFS transporter
MFILSPLRQRPIALLWGGQVLSSIGDQIYRVAIVWMAVSLIGTNAGLLPAAEAASILLFGTFVGVWADRWDHRTTMIWADAIRCAIVLLPPVLAYFSGFSIWALFPVAIVAAALEALFEPSLRALIPAVVPDASLAQAANGLMDTTLRIAFVVGPAIVAGLGRVIPTIHFFTFDAATFALSALSVWAIRPSRAPEVSGLMPNRAESLTRSITAAIRAINAYPILRFEMFGTSIVWGLWNLCFTLGLALLIRQRWGGGIGAYGLAVSAYGIGNVLSALIVGSLRIERPGRFLFGGWLFMGIGFAGLAVSANMHTLAVAAAVSAIGGPMEDLAFVGMLQSGCETVDIARVYRFRMVVGNASYLFFFLLSPVIFKFLSVPLVMGLSAVAIFSCGIAGIARFFSEPMPLRNALVEHGAQ